MGFSLSIPTDRRFLKTPSGGGRNPLGTADHTSHKRCPEEEDNDWPSKKSNANDCQITLLHNRVHQLTSDDGSDADIRSSKNEEIREQWGYLARLRKHTDTWLEGAKG